MASAEIAAMVQTKACGDLVDYWQHLRGSRRLPRRTEVDPAAIVPLLPYLYLIEMQATGGILVRLAGTALRQLYGIEMTGHDMIDLAPPDHQTTRRWRYRQAAQRPCGMYYVRRQNYGSGAEDELETIFLPLAAADADASVPAWQFIGLAASLSDQGWIAEPGVPPLPPPHLFRFVDIGFGVPATIVPADETR